jgi:hypothetical protein
MGEPPNESRPQHLPRGIWSWVIENVLWITLAVAAAAATGLVVWKDQIFG